MKICLRSLVSLAVGYLFAGTVVAASTAGPTLYQTANVWDPAVGPGERIGAAWLIREKQKIRGRMMSKVPTAGVPQTLWIVVFNNPSACAGSPCMDTDIGNAAVGASVFNGSGAISAADGNGSGVFNVDFELPAGQLPDGLFVLVGDPKGLHRGRGFGAEVHLIIDEHPLPADSWISDLTTTHFPGAGPNSTVAVAILLGCSSKSCPASVL